MPERDWEKDWKLCEQRYSRPEDWLVATIYNSEGKIISSKVYLPNARLVMEAREALSYWLQRVRELEKECSELRARVSKLEAVAEAVRWYFSTCDHVECFPKDDKFYRCHTEDSCSMERLEKALAALEEASKESEEV